ncbi:MAG: tRNA (adenosine(37)-N6)-threonylcarbamoyltransferase complex transferase subunit TsaD [Bacteroidetes bacterium]|nr:tRNA (adenosine(37)-N6)-threonylcarbamoyltransferase complex transferase subunit TsaD [Bacteroidota bacterium]
MISILAIESSCDDTCAAVCSDAKILSNVIANQEVHAKYGGVVPELASRAHMRNIVPVVDEALKRAQLSLNDMDAIAFTQAPGLLGSLLVGAQFAKSLSLVLNMPLIAVHHMQAHVLANLIGEKKPSFPFLCLTVSGGHTQIVKANSPLDLEILGETLDDAAGEAFDKSAKLLGLPYPGGPLIDKYAKEGDPLKFTFARPLPEGINFSFSGLKTSVMYFLRDAQKNDPEFLQMNMQDLCASIQYTIIEILIKKLIRASELTGIKEICIAGGVSANSGLRKAIEKTGKEKNWNIYIPDFQYCTDNAAMIAITAYYKFREGQFASLKDSPSARALW